MSTSSINSSVQEASAHSLNGFVCVCVMHAMYVGYVGYMDLSGRAAWCANQERGQTCTWPEVVRDI